MKVATSCGRRFVAEAFEWRFDYGSEWKADSGKRKESRRLRSIVAWVGIGGWAPGASDSVLPCWRGQRRWE